MITKMCKYIRELKAKNKRKTLISSIGNKIRQACLGFVPLVENPLFLEVWGDLIELATI